MCAIIHYEKIDFGECLPPKNSVLLLIHRVEFSMFSQSRKLLLLFLTGLVIALVAQSWEKTSLTACINGSISLRGDDWSRFADELSFQTRHKDGH